MSTDQDEIWQHATGEQTENTPETPVEAPTEAKTERARDERGKFVKATPEPTTGAGQEELPQPEVVKDAFGQDVREREREDDARIPSWRLKEESDRRREAEQAVNELRGQMWQMQMALQQRQQQAPQQEAPDIFADPQGFIHQMQNQLNEQVKLMRMESSLERAAMRHGEDVFAEAYDAFTNYYQRTRDEATLQRVKASAHPGDAMVQWHKEQKLHEQLRGKDLNSFLSDYEQELMKKPEFQAKVIELFRATQQAQPGNTVTQVPPSLSRAPAAKSAHDNSGASAQDIWAYANKR